MKDTFTKIKNHLSGINSRVHEAENQSSDLEYKKAKCAQSEQEKNYQKNKDTARSLWDNFKCTNICIMRVLEGQEREQKIMTEHFPNLVNEIDIQIQEVQCPKQEEHKELQIPTIYRDYTYKDTSQLKCQWLNTKRKS
uniref:Uncharacterized protein n=1 Tax=Pipistrellus kuhlii TaxID=59472 RepID=A0A7J7ZL36_PIPKU|nr:hypothetical protein mPipKuh1_009639 [Pipistrellus kuhlii]